TIALRIVWRANGIEKMSAVGQKRRLSMTLGRAKNFGDRFAATAALANPMERPRNRRDEDNRAVTIPRGTSVCRVRDALQRAAAEIDRLDLAIGMKSDVLAVGSPEWREGAFGAVDASRVYLGQTADP